MLNYVLNIDKYITHCYNLLDEENKEKLHDMKTRHDNLMAKL